MLAKKVPIGKSVNIEFLKDNKYLKHAPNPKFKIYEFISPNLINIY